MGNKHSQGKKSHGGEYLKRSSSQTPKSFSSNQHSLEKSRHSSLANLKHLLRGNSKETLKQVFKMAETINKDATIVVTAHPMTTFGDYDSGRDQKVPQKNACVNAHDQVPFTRSRSSALINAILIKKLEEAKYQQPPIKSPETPHYDTARQLMFHKEDEKLPSSSWQDVCPIGFDPRSPTPDVARTPIKKQGSMITRDLDVRELNKLIDLNAIPFDDEHLRLHSQVAFTPTDGNMLTSSGRSIMDDDGDEHNEDVPVMEETQKSSKPAPKKVTDVSNDDLSFSKRNSFVLPSPILAFDPSKKHRKLPPNNKEILDIPMLNIESKDDIQANNPQLLVDQELVTPAANNTPSTQGIQEMGTIPPESCEFHKEDDFEILPNDMNNNTDEPLPSNGPTISMKKMPSLKPVPFMTPQPYHGGYMSPSPLHRAAAAATNSSPLFGNHSPSSEEACPSSNSDSTTDSTISSVYATPTTPTRNDHKENYSNKQEPIFTNIAVITNNGAKFLPKLATNKEVSSRTNHRDHAATVVATKHHPPHHLKKSSKSPLKDISNNNFNNYIR